ncbi:MAG: hypothetical protein KBA66_19535 [Leptospiraceae bacterium]|nr:hypothetical protein [Leptospiraceae bacterium]
MNSEDNPTSDILQNKNEEPISSEGLYYFENGLMVFTEKFHLRRGYCCGNGCRHCPFKK